MPSQGLSLVGFLDEPQALLHFNLACVPPPGINDAQLRIEWLLAKNKLGAAFAHAGQPNVTPIPLSHASYAAAVFQLPWVIAAFQGQSVTDANVKLVEIDPLLAYQFTVDLTRSDHHCGNLSAPPTVNELFSICLPMAQASENYNFQVLGQSALIKSRSLNLRVSSAGITNNMAAGILFGAALPLVQVTRLSGRSYLHNGFHRAVGLRRRGATHIPCILRDVPDAGSAGIRNDGSTFSDALLTSADPPTLGHFTQGRGYSVQLRAMSRIIHVSWADYVWPEE
jgi:hypothetical protein